MKTIIILQQKNTVGPVFMKAPKSFQILAGDYGYKKISEKLIKSCIRLSSSQIFSAGLDVERCHKDGGSGRLA